MNLNKLVGLLYSAAAASGAETACDQYVSKFMVTADILYCSQPMPQQELLDEQISLSVL